VRKKTRGLLKRATGFLDSASSQREKEKFRIKAVEAALKKRAKVIRKELEVANSKEDRKRLQRELTLIRSKRKKILKVLKELKSS
jgi:hypothetical protein